MWKYDTGQLKTDMSLVNIMNRKYPFTSEIAAILDMQVRGMGTSLNALEILRVVSEVKGGGGVGCLEVFSGIDATEEYQHLFLVEENCTNSW